MTKPIAFIDLATQRDRVRDRVEARFKRILDDGSFIMGPDVAELEAALSAFGGMSETLSCGSGTDALLLPLSAWGIRPGDAVFCPSFTFAATAEVVAMLGASAVFVDVLPHTFNMDPDSLAAAIEETIAADRLKPRAVITVDLFGLAADYPAIREICDRHGLKLLSDAAQGYGSTLDGRQASAWADVVATSFYPAKPLGCYGDGGAVQTNDKPLADIMRSLRVHGGGTDRYDNVRIGMNARMDTLQAAVVIEKLAIFPEEIESRMRIGRRYRQGLPEGLTPQMLPNGAVSTFAQYTVRVSGGRRDAFMAGMKARGVPTVIYYPRPLHRQTAYGVFPVAGGVLPVTDTLAEEVVSLPMHAYLDEATQDTIMKAAREALAEA
ncbi:MULTISPECIES: DegT/DnrJ/EryC1/StrS family aminotransferase [unclassified Aureimonas]|uniref:DegT/DnrJ/EryC1/StrS family aminotransferase n=1 Tax=unclassified Aureimonas TaxID=2615206 RepID=UPI00070107AA|nr:MULTISPECIES: DegT/DnrJ/EryC1/StrS aminotransferase family protein [unclassified Aureimonas]KQT57337.1 aminotransferase DegT [Aureimonas sp. Leaf427]KQT77017.1 aminotransferase DegT [Aureimonas sp. Leaf460]